MAVTQEEKQKISIQDLEELMKKAQAKLGAEKENDICRYIPVPTGGYIHHFTMRKMKTENPWELATLIKKHIINPDMAVSVKPKPRAARGSRKRRDQFYFSKQDIDKLLQMARVSGDKEIMRKLMPKKDLRQLKKDLLSSIRNNQVDQDLWNQYCESLAQQSSSHEA